MTTIGHTKVVARVREAYPDRAVPLDAVALCMPRGAYVRQMVVVVLIVALSVSLAGSVGGGIVGAGLAGAAAGGAGAAMAFGVVWLAEWRMDRGQTGAHSGRLTPRFYLALTPDHLMVVRASVTGKPGAVVERIPRTGYRVADLQRKRQTVRLTLATPDGRTRHAEGASSGAMAVNARAVEAIAAAGSAAPPPAPTAVGWAQPPPGPAQPRSPHPGWQQPDEPGSWTSPPT